MAKVLISFLGTNKYVPCIYHSSTEPGQTCRTSYVQEAIIRLYMKPSSSDDRIVIFLTDLARKLNWVCAENRTGLQSIIENMKKRREFDFMLSDVAIHEITCEEDMWNVFEKMKENIPDNSEVLFDMTHSFRSIPMLGIVLFNYLRVIKNVRLSGIYYGAFEKLGSIKEASSLDEDSRLVPILDLAPLDYIMRFSFAADDFVSFGNSESLRTLLMEKAKPILSRSRGADKLAKEIEYFSKNLDTVTQSIATNRGLDIYRGEIFTRLKSNLENLKQTEGTKGFQALYPLFDKIEKKIEQFKNDDIGNGIRAVKWCIDHGLVQPGITLLHETILTGVCAIAGIDHTNREWREFTSSCVHFISTGKPFEEMNIKELDRAAAQDAWERLNSSGILGYVKVYNALSDTRNSINHGGMNIEDKKEPRELIMKLKKVYAEAAGLLGA